MDLIPYNADRREKKWKKNKKMCEINKWTYIDMFE